MTSTSRQAAQASAPVMTLLLCAESDIFEWRLQPTGTPTIMGTRWIIGLNGRGRGYPV